MADGIDNGVRGLAPVPAPREGAAAVERVSLEQLFEVAEEFLAAALGDRARQQPRRN